MRTIYLALAALLLFSCKKNTETQNSAIETTSKKPLRSDQFRIEGELEKFKDSTMVGLFINNDIVDSTFIINSKFSFEGDFKEPIDARILVKQTDFFADFWIENGTLTLKNKTGKRFDTKIEGGKVQKEENLLTERIVIVSKKRDSIYKILSNPETDNDTKSKTKEYLETIDKEEKEVCFSFLEEHPNSVASMRLLNIFKSVWDKSVITKAYNQADTQTQQSRYGKIIGSFIELSGNPKKGDQFIDFTQNDPNNNPIKFSKVKKKYTLLNFWSSWCTRCRKLNPELGKVYNDFKSKGFEIIGVSFDQNKDTWTKAIKKDNITWLQVSDLNGWENTVGYMYGIKNIPENFLIDAKGTIIDTRLTPNRLRAVLSKVLK